MCVVAAAADAVIAVGVGIVAAIGIVAVGGGEFGILLESVIVLISVSLVRQAGSTRKRTRSGEKERGGGGPLLPTAIVGLGGEWTAIAVGGRSDVSVGGVRSRRGIVGGY